MKPDVVFVLGGPGAGKGTQCERIIKEFNFVHLSAGELLRLHRNDNTPQGKIIDQSFIEGKLIPVEITLELLEKAMHQSDVKRFLIDGFPRDKDNLDGWNRVMSEKVNLICVLFFDCPKEVCVERCLKRERSDDNSDALKKRLGIYYKDTMPIIEYYRKLDLLKKIDATKSADEVFKLVKSILQDILKE